MDKKDGESMATTLWGIHTKDDYLFLNSNVIAIGWKEFGDLKAVEPSREAFKEHYESVYENAKKGSIGTGAGMLFRFCYEMQVGDYVVYPSKIDRKYISLCQQADAFKTDKKKGDCSEYPTAAFCLYGIIFYPVVLLSLFSLTSLVSRHIAVHEQYHRPAGAGGVGTEAAVIVAGGDALFNSPGDRLLIRA